MDETAEYKAWLDKNADKAGTPDYVKVAEAYAKSQDTPFSDFSGPAGVGMAPGMRDEASATDPNTPLNIARRVVTGAVTGLPDVGIAGVNALSRAGVLPQIPTDSGQLPYLGPMAIKATGGLPLAADASTTQQLLEGGASALLGGGAQAAARAAMLAPTAGRAIRAVLTKLGTSTALPTIASHKGGEYGENIAEMMKVDPETGALIGSLLGGAAPGAARAAPARFTDWRYRGQGKPNAPEIAAAAAAEGIQLPASALGNESIRLRENSYANRFGDLGYTNRLRSTARDQTGQGWNEMATDRGAQDPMPSRGSLGTDLGAIAQDAAAEGNQLVSARQEYLQQRAAPTGDISGLIAEMRRIANSTDAITAQPIETRIAGLESRLPRDPVTGDITSYETPYQHVKDSRTGTRVASTNVGGVPGHYAGQVEDAHTAFMRDAAVRGGLSPQAFDRIQEFTARLKGINDITGEKGPIPRLEDITRQTTANPETGYNFLKRGEQKPANLSLLLQTQRPEVNTLLGDYIRRIGQETINDPNQGAGGPRLLGTRMENMNEQSRPLLFGPQEQRAQNLALVARALNAPTRQGGLGQTMGQVTPSIPGALTAGEIGSNLGAATGIPFASSIGRTLGYMAGPAQRFVGAHMMQHPAALNALARGPRPNNYGYSDLIAAITAASTPLAERGPPLAGQ
jgi:hypothetical protein